VVPTTIFSLHKEENKLFKLKFENKSNTPRNSSLSAIALILILAFSTFAATATLANAAGTSVMFTPYHEYTTVGINQAIRFGIAPTPNMLTSAPYNTQAEELDTAYVTFTKPDGTTDVLQGPFRVDWVRRTAVLFDYVPDQTGTWTMTFTWPGDSTYAAGSCSETFTVQQAQIPLRDTTASLAFRPNPIGKGQSLLINAWITPRPVIPGDWYEDVNFIFTKPDGSTETVGPMKTYGEASLWFTYTPDQVGKYTIQLVWEGTVFEKGASTEKQELIVQEQPISDWPAAEDPASALTYPVNSENREWANLIGPYLVPTGATAMGYDCSGSRFNPYTEGPNSAHINWIIPPVSGAGGLVGGQYGQILNYAASAASINVVMAGRGYYQAGSKICCVDITTGELLWSTTGSYTFGLIEGTATLSQSPVLVKISAAGNSPTAGNLTLQKYDALTGAKTLDVTIASDSGAKYTFLAMDYTYAYVAQVPAGVDEHFGPCNLFKIKITGTETTNRVVYNVNYPFGLSDFGICLYNDVLAKINYGVYGPSGAINTTTGEVLWSTPLEELDGVVNMLAKAECTTSADGVLFFPVDNMKWAAINMATGETEWISEQAEYPWGDFWAYGHSTAYGNLYALSYAGVYAIDQDTGNIVWHYSAGDSGLETPYGTWPFGSIDPIIADGKVYAPTSEHSPAIYYRGQQLHCIDATSGDKVWSIMGYYTPTAISGGILFASNAYDGNEYAFGKGTTATTVAVQNDVYTKGSSILIKGTVLDMSPAQAGTAAVSDASMSAWMEYLHMQQPKPTDATGVVVKLTATDSNGQSVDIGSVTSNVEGGFAFLWTPQSEGTYTVTASFEGSESYYASSAKTSVGVTAADSSSPSVTSSPSVPSSPSTASPSTSESPSTVQSQAPASTGLSSSTMYIAIAAVVVIIAVIAAALVLRKRSK
jgi:hypothetical protein